MRLWGSQSVWIMAFLSLLFFTFGGVEVEEKTSEQTTPLVLGSWSAPRNLDFDYFRLLVDLGFTHTLYWKSPEINVEQWKRDLDRAHHLGLSLVFDSWQPAAVPQEWLQAVLQTACLHPAFSGVYAPDEPGYRFPLEEPLRRPSLKQFKWAYRKMKSCGRGVLLQVDAASAQEKWIRQFLPYCTAFGFDIYPYKRGVDWRERVQWATHQAALLADERPLWMVLQGHGRTDWYNYATKLLNWNIGMEDGPRPSVEVLWEMAEIARKEGADGIWWWSFELYDWKNPEHQSFILKFRNVHHRLRSRADWETDPQLALPDA